ncbi:hypothetical protein LCGC14_2866230 [marine sediment metagenome]|uniref:Uncharacterized protein n=1 Tax=marine sediment metagenome TaxID=412755 RepID=A0A0F8Y427_9ZZZZ
MLPRFFLSEDWDLTSGNVDIHFQDIISQELYDHVESEIKRITPKLDKEERTTYHLEQIIGGIFSNAAVKGKLKKDPDNQWVLAGMQRCQK